MRIEHRRDRMGRARVEQVAHRCHVVTRISVERGKAGPLRSFLKTSKCPPPY